MPRKERLVRWARIVQITLAVIMCALGITLTQTSYNESPYVLGSVIYDSIGIALCGLFGMILSQALQGFADHDFYKTIHPLLLMLIFDLMSFIFDIAALACLLVGGQYDYRYNAVFWAIPITCSGLNLVPITYLLVRTARIYWSGTISAAIAERIAREEQQWHDNEAGGQPNHGYAKSVARSSPSVQLNEIEARLNEIESRAGGPREAASIASQPLSTVHTELSGPKTLGTAHRSILSAPSRAPPSYVTPSEPSRVDAYNGA